MRIKGIQWALPAAVLAMSASAFAAPPTPAMLSNVCAGCHGSHGQGVGQKSQCIAAVQALNTVKKHQVTTVVYLGLRIFRAAKVSLTVEAPGRNTVTSPSRSFWLGLTTQVSNPKTAIVDASVFAALLPGSYSRSFAAVLLLVVFVIEAGWYAVVATVLLTVVAVKAQTDPNEGLRDIKIFDHPKFNRLYEVTTPPVILYPNQEVVVQDVDIAIDAKAGAFNILDVIRKGYDLVRLNTGRELGVLRGFWATGTDMTDTIFCSQYSHATATCPAFRQIINQKS